MNGFEFEPFGLRYSQDSCKQTNRNLKASERFVILNFQVETKFGVDSELFFKVRRSAFDRLF